MPVGISVRVEGLPRVLASLDYREGRQLLARTKLGLRSGGSVLVAPMRREAPVRTGVLRRSVSVRTARDGSVSVGPRAWYRHFVIRGTSRGVRPNPFVDRAVNNNLDAAKQRVEDVILRGRR